MKYRSYVLSLVSSLIVFSLSAQTPQELKSWLPSIPGWEINEEIEVFDPDNLFDRINGAAPLFIENNFREMTSVEYKKDKDYITLQIYRHASPEDAFGMYASERSTELAHYPIGGEAQGDPSSLFFFAGHIYVKMWATSQENLETVLHQIGTGLAERIDPKAAYPTILRFFPAEGKQPYSEAYITSNYIGHEFLKQIYLAKYEREGKAFQLFVIDGNSADGAKDILTKYFTFARQPLEFAEGALVIKDRYNGDIPAIWKGRYIVAAYSENGEAIAGVEELLKSIAAAFPD
ncbi:hypothetical protein M2480_000448 [Parabacteroides sp. PFB2-12]|uniref:DUF6599 family protein n=1 Tax=unclassified Parabacteroides TaxID=2649774 RepID=UPI002473ED70|nr:MULTISPECIES: DUF6599 family protein [unclassified Parabacteroides]MDH6342069.1 hypothetical protein [Parabacteroides sp. PM6-13]MDH6389488.1 hypothetical protein [Parabacteroides sp. PFB2-12]